MQRSDLQPFLTALQEVDANLARRDARAEGAMLVAWGVAAGAGMAFYRVARPHRSEFAAGLGPAFELLFLVPFALAFALTLVIGARYRRLDVASRNADTMTSLAAVAIGIAIVVAGRALGQFAWIGAGLVLMSAAVLFARMRSRAHGPARSIAFALAALGAPIGVALFFLPYTTSYAVAALYWGVGWTLAGTVLYLRGG